MTNLILTAMALLVLVDIVVTILAKRNRRAQNVYLIIPKKGSAYLADEWDDAFMQRVDDMEGEVFFFRQGEIYKLWEIGWGQVKTEEALKAERE